MKNLITLLALIISFSSLAQNTQTLDTKWVPYGFGTKKYLVNGEQVERDKFEAIINTSCASAQVYNSGKNIRNIGWIMLGTGSLGGAAYEINKPDTQGSSTIDNPTGFAVATTYMLLSVATIIYGNNKIKNSANIFNSRGNTAYYIQPSDAGIGLKLVF